MDTPKQRQSHRARKGAQQPLLAFTEFIAEYEHLREKALTVLRRDGAHNPIVILFTDAGREVVGLQIPRDRAMHEIIKAVVQARHARAFVAIAEAWMVYGPGAAEAIPPSRHPERQQVLAISAVHPEGARGWFVPFSTEGGRLVTGTPVDSVSSGLTLGGGIPGALPGEEEER